jgi:glycine/D-amino acid oxidase-like deaminating enzyme
VVIAGGGVLGTMHAVMARRRGFEVVQLEREAEARGASVRNFGLVWVSGRKAGPELSLALRARALWAELGAQVPGIGFRPAGSLTLAAGDAELALLKEAAALPDADRREFELLDPAAVRAVNPALRGEFTGGLFCRADAIVEPRELHPSLKSRIRREKPDVVVFGHTHKLAAGPLASVLEKLSQTDLPNLWKPRADQFFHVDAFPYLGTGKLDLRKVRETALQVNATAAGADSK